MSQPNQPDSGIKSSIVWGVTLITISIVAVTGALIAMNKPIDSLLTMVIIVAVPALTYLGTRIHTINSQVRESVMEVKQQVNGRLSEALGTLLDIARTLATEKAGNGDKELSGSQDGNSKMPVGGSEPTKIVGQESN